MSAVLNHTIVPASDKRASADFLTHILGVEPGLSWGPFVNVELANGVTLAYVDTKGFEEHHYAFLVEEAEFDPILQRIRAVGAAFYADPFRHDPGRINHHHGGRGVYFDDPDGHRMEVITHPYGEEPAVEVPGFAEGRAGR